MKSTAHFQGNGATALPFACAIFVGSLLLAGCSKKGVVRSAGDAREEPAAASLAAMESGAFEATPAPERATPAQERTAEAGGVPAENPSEAVKLTTAEWPQEFVTEGEDVVLLYQPEIDQWNDFETMRIRAALEVREKDAAEATYGALWMTGRTDTDAEERQVLFSDREIEELRFPGMSDAEAGMARQVVLAAMPEAEPLVFNLDWVLASVESPALGESGLEVNLDPPPIFYSSRPAMLIIFLGEPAFDVVREGSPLEFSVNTNWDLFREPATGRHFVQVEDGWLETQDLLRGPWKEAADLPAAFSELPADENWNEVRSNLPGNKLAVVPEVFVSTQPAEMIVTAGPPEYEDLPGIALSYVVNTDSTVFLHRDERNFYFLAAGRWFRAPALQGPWLAATFDLPGDFLKLPEGEEWADVRAAVPGTPEAEQAVLLASIPRKAEVNRSEAALEVDYDGDPEFVPIEGAQSIGYATNTPYDVLSVGAGSATEYYACHQGVWFESVSPHGPWVLCDNVPDSIYTIPPSSPKYNVSYVRVYESTPTTVVTGYYPGYLGNYVVGGALLFGLGYWIGSEFDDHRHHHGRYWRSYRYRPYWYSYGSGARYRHSHGGYLRMARYYGPYGGAGRVAVWNPYSRNYMRGYKAYGPRGGSWARGAYRPFTDTWRGRPRASTPYATWGRTAVTRGDRWVEARRWEERRQTTARGRGREDDRFVRDGRRGSRESAFVRRGDEVRVSRDGHVYRQRDDGWQSWEKSQGWAAADGEEVRRGRQERGRVAITQSDRRPGPRTTVRDGDGSRDRSASVEREARPEGRRAVAEDGRDRESAREGAEREGVRREGRPGVVDGSRDRSSAARRRTSGDEPSGAEGRAPSTRREEPAPRQGAPSTRREEPAPRQGAPSTRREEPAPRQGAPSTRREERAPRQSAPSTRREEPAPRQCAPSTRRE
ncbi:MAG TPA: hypothetical protein VMN36_01315, partial [Verrucomicrobiales bacterium]|nr:hypothetical protein [Verrucomicrobiales bacterium]